MATITSSPTRRLLTETRSAMVAGSAGAAAGLVVAGLGGRLVMRVSMLVASGNVEGRLTEGGNRIGDFTVDGTIGLLLFGGLLTGLIAGIYWYALRPTVKLLGAGELPAAAVIGVVVGGLLIIDPDNRDFDILEPAGLQIALFLGLAAVAGVSLAGFDRLFERILPSGNRSLFVYLPLVALGAVFLIPAFGSLLSNEFCFCHDPPVVTGALLLGAFAVTVTGAVWNVIAPDSLRPPWLRWAGTVLAAGTIVAGAIQVTRLVLATI